MKLNDWMVENGVTSPAFARRIKASLGTVQKWRRGARVPRPGYMRAIMQATKNQVGPLDFYGVKNGDKRTGKRH